MVAKRSAMRRAATAARRSFASAEAKVAAEANGAKSEPPPVSGSGLLLKSMLFVGGTGVGVGENDPIIFARANQKREAKAESKRSQLQRVGFNPKGLRRQASVSCR